MNLTPPVTVPTGQRVAWAYPTSSTAFAPGLGACPNCFGTWCAFATASSTLTGGSIAMSGSCSQGWGAAYCQWSDFNLTLPSGATINSIYPVVISYGYADVVDQIFKFGVGSPSGQNFIYPGQVSGSFPETQWTSSGSPPSSLGNTMTVVNDSVLEYAMTISISGDTYPDYVNITAVALAVYITVPPPPPVRVSINLGATRQLSSIPAL